MASQIIEPEPDLRLILVPAADDAPLSSREYQQALSDFVAALRALNVEVVSRAYAFDALEGGGGLSGQFTVIAATLAPVITGAAGFAGAWFQAKYGRKIRVKFGDIEIEAPTLEELKEALRLIEQKLRHDQAAGKGQP